MAQRPRPQQLEIVRREDPRYFGDLAAALRATQVRGATEGPYSTSDA